MTVQRNSEFQAIPHGGKLVNRILEGNEREQWLAKAASLPKLELDGWALSDVEMTPPPAGQPILSAVPHSGAANGGAPAGGWGHPTTCLGLPKADRSLWAFLLKQHLG